MDAGHTMLVACLDMRWLLWLPSLADSDSDSDSVTVKRTMTQCAVLSCLLVSMSTKGQRKVKTHSLDCPTLMTTCTYGNCYRLNGLKTKRGISCYIKILYGIWYDMV